VLFLFLNAHVVDMDVDAMPGLFIGFLGTERVPRFFNVNQRKSFFTHLITNGSER
jgi:hypothetical protein